MDIRNMKKKHVKEAEKALIHSFRLNIVIIYYAWFKRLSAFLTQIQHFNILTVLSRMKDKLVHSALKLEPEGMLDRELARVILSRVSIH